MSIPRALFLAVCVLSILAYQPHGRSVLSSRRQPAPEPSARRPRLARATCLIPVGVDSHGMEGVDTCGLIGIFTAIDSRSR